MHNEQERWERLCAAVKERGARIRRRRQVAAGFVGAVVALLLFVAVPGALLFKERSAHEQEMREAEVEVALLAHDLLLEETGLY